jgi:hypothetical protein
MSEKNKTETCSVGKDAKTGANIVSSLDPQVDHVTQPERVTILKVTQYDIHITRE